MFVPLPPDDCVREHSELSHSSWHRVGGLPGQDRSADFQAETLRRSLARCFHVRGSITCAEVERPVAYGVVR